MEQTLEIVLLIFQIQFLKIIYDQIDLDFCEGIVQNNFFVKIDNSEYSGDGIDLSGSKVMIKDNSIFNLKDKGISVGENTIAIINNNNFKNNNIAIAIKDESKIYSFENIFSNNKLRFSMYIKKFFYGSPALFLNKDEYNNFNFKELNELFDIKDGL